jgi:hypothetical protein
MITIKKHKSLKPARFNTRDRLKIQKTLAVILLIILAPFIPLNSFAQSAEDTTDGRFHDDLLNHLVGNWDVIAIAHGSRFTSDLEAKWVMNHQHLLIHLKSHEIIPWWHVQMEYEEYIGYSHIQKRYVVHGMSIENYDYDPSEGFCYGYRAGNEFKTVAKFGEDSLIVQRFIWEATSGTWNIKSNWVIAGKEGEVFLDMKLVAAKPSLK